MLKGSFSVLFSLTLSTVVLLIVFVMNKRLQEQLKDLRTSVANVETKLGIAAVTADRCTAQLSGPQPTGGEETYLDVVKYGGGEDGAEPEAFEDDDDQDDDNSSSSGRIEHMADMMGGGDMDPALMAVSANLVGVEPFTVDAAPQAPAAGLSGMAAQAGSVIEVQSKDVRQFDQGNTVCFCIPKSAVRASAPRPDAGMPGAAPPRAAGGVQVVRAPAAGAPKPLATAAQAAPTIEPFVEVGESYADVGGDGDYYLVN